MDLGDVKQHARGVPVLERVGRRGERRAAHVRADLARLVGERGAPCSITRRSVCDEGRARSWR